MIKEKAKKTLNKNMINIYLHHGGEVPGEGSACVLDVECELGGADLELSPVHLLYCGLGLVFL